MKRTFEITKVTPKQDGTGHVVTLRTTTIGKDVFKTKKSETYHVSATADGLEVGQKHEVDINDYTVIESQFEGDDGQTITAKWLTLKA